MTIKLYLAGPDVFHSEAARLGAAKKALCARHGFHGLFPLDTPVPPGNGAATSRAIHAACVAMMSAADAGIFNLTPFRGPSADVGTAVELGHMAALDKPVFAYTNAAGDLVDRLRKSPGLSLDDEGERWRDPDAFDAEDFGNADNLMLDETLIAQGRRILRPAETDLSFTDLSGFERCLEAAAAHFRETAGSGRA